MPLSRDSTKRSRQLANLRSAPAAPSGNRRALRHGGYAAIARERLDSKAHEIYEALASDAPLRAPDGDLPAGDAVVVSLMAECLCRLEDVRANVSTYGAVHERSGKVRPAAELEARLRREAFDYAESLGCTPRARARLGFDLTRTVGIASALSEAEAVELPMEPEWQQRVARVLEEANAVAPQAVVRGHFKADET